MERREVHHRIEVTEELEKRVFRAGFSDIAQWRARLAQAELAVCRIEAPAWQALGTGFLVGPDLVMTNRHVIEPFASRRKPPILARFDFKLSGDGARLREGEAFALAPEWLVASSPIEELDFAILRLAQPAGLRPTTGGTGGIARGWIAPQWRPLEPDETIFVIQHPQGETLKLAAGRFEAREPTRLRYRVDTEPGSSGAPCFTAQMELIALHRGAAEGLANQGVPIDAVQAALPPDFFPTPPLPSPDAGTGTWQALADVGPPGVEHLARRQPSRRLAIAGVALAVGVAAVGVPLWRSRDATPPVRAVTPKTTRQETVPPSPPPPPPLVREVRVPFEWRQLAPTDACASGEGVERALYRLTTTGPWPASDAPRARDVQVTALSEVRFAFVSIAMSGGVEATAVAIPQRVIARRGTFAEPIVPPVVIVACVEATPPGRPAPAFHVNTWREIPR